MSGKIRILVCDDHTLFREGLKALIANEPDLEVVGEAEDGKEAIDKVKQLQPHVVLMDISMPLLNGFEAAQRIVETYKNTHVLVLTMYDEDDLIIRCLEAGASGYVLKDAPAKQLVYAIREVRKGGKYLSPSVVNKVVEQYLQTSVRPKDTYDSLSGREREVLRVLAEGHSVKEIAYRLKLSVKTVEAHKYNLMRKLDVHDRTELVKYAIQKKLIRLSEVKR
ncbi:MAG TPA: response regulator transcription factor [Terriglobia bacterium]|nr:response regulator transcription factor [Terriglobia bacterium]